MTGPEQEVEGVLVRESKMKRCEGKAEIEEQIKEIEKTT